MSQKKKLQQTQPRKIQKNVGFSNSPRSPLGLFCPAIRSSHSSANRCLSSSKAIRLVISAWGRRALLFFSGFRWFLFFFKDQFYFDCIMFGFVVFWGFCVCFVCFSFCFLPPLAKFLQKVGFLLVPSRISQRNSSRTWVTCMFPKCFNFALWSSFHFCWKEFASERDSSVSLAVAYRFSLLTEKPMPKGSSNHGVPHPQWAPHTLEALPRRQHWGIPPVLILFRPWFQFSKTGGIIKNNNINN